MHSVPVEADPTIGAWSGPPILADPTYDYLVGESVPFVVDTEGLQLNFTPDGHEEGFGTENFREYDTEPWDAGAPADIAMGRASGLAHSQDYGASVAQNYDDPPFQASDERYLSYRFEGFGPVELPALAGGGQRGLNSYGVNNPPLESYGGRGYRYGWVEQAVVDRKMYDATRVHDERLITPNTATEFADQPVPADAGRYNEPFGSLQRAMTTISQRPMMRRQPPAMDQSIMVDGTEDVYYADSDWVM